MICEFRKGFRLALLFLLCCFLLVVPGCGEKGNDRAISGVPSSLSIQWQHSFEMSRWNNPPMECRPYIRWWWPGGAVEIDELEREIQVFHDAGFGGVEIQPYLFGFRMDEIENDPAIRSVGTPEFLQKVRAASEKAHELGMGFDFTLGSGWSSGGTFVTNAPERQLLMSELEVVGPRLYKGPVPPLEPPAYQKVINSIIDALGPFDTEAELVAVTVARVADNEASPPIIDSFADVTSLVHEDTLTWDVPEGTWAIFAFYQNRTNHHPVGAAYPGAATDALIADHLNPEGAREMIEGYAQPLLDALADFPPDTVFVDSFEMIGELPWTSSFLEQFKALKGYDLTPYLPLVFRQGGESKYTTILNQAAGVASTPLYSAPEIEVRIREDYEDVRSNMFMSGFVQPILDWAHRNGLALRLQAHGGWADYLSAYEMADIPESEGLFAGGSYDFLKMASSAAHTGGHKYASSETFVSLHNDPWAPTIEDLHLLAGRAFSAGINRIAYHGSAYRYIRENGKRWLGFPKEKEPGMILAGPLPFTTEFDEDYPAWSDIPAFNQYLSRLGYALSLGTHHADVAWLHNEWDTPDRVVSSAGGFSPEQGESAISLSMKRAGYVYDRVSRNGLASSIVEYDSFRVGAANYRALLLTDLNVATPELMAAIEKIADAGIPVIALGNLPRRAPGLVDWEGRDAATREISARLESKISFATGANQVGPAMLAAGVRPSIMTLNGEEILFSLDRRELDDGDVLFLFNESNADRSQELNLLVPARRVLVLDPGSSDLIAQAAPDQLGRLSLKVSIPARRSLILLTQK